MGWRIEFAPRARKQLNSLDPGVARRIVEFLRTRVAATDDPRRLGEPLKGGRFGDYWRYRIGDYRVVVSIEEGALRVLVVQIGHRREIYR
ncbi:type II toxin-antitoxin system RelE/ParE family toxin [uncultured Enterovirga sp.]|uniref:type II toxin-antitoxin system RelE family toxin n=1 Tax=uncultured Enterovirga sp. TaxID=2026352 RepID=UPI0035CA740A